MKRIPVVPLALVITTLTVGFSSVRAQAPASALDGIYTDEQAKRGEKVYADNCAICHGDKLEGTSTGGPALSGKDFINGWKGMTAGELIDKISMDMPSNAPGSLKPDQYADVMAYVLSVNKYPAGKTPLPTTSATLKTVKMMEPK
jgi:S-disulfanyl-L-cysteine oxidoreductase SoxD